MTLLCLSFLKLTNLLGMEILINNQKHTVEESTTLQTIVNTQLGDKQKGVALAVNDVKLSSLLEMTKAINNNLSTSQLLDIYQDILENRLKVGKLVLFSFDMDWTCILKYGVDSSYNHLVFE